MNKLHEVIAHLSRSAKWMATDEGQKKEGYDKDACLLAEKLLQEYADTLWDLPEGAKPPSIESVLVKGDYEGANDG